MVRRFKVGVVRIVSRKADFLKFLRGSLILKWILSVFIKKYWSI